MNMRSVVYQLRLFLWVGIGLMMGLLLVACNDDAPTTTSSEPTATAVAEIPPSPTTAPTDTAAPTATHTAEPPTATPTAELPTATPTVEPPTPTPAPTNTPQPNLPALPPDAQRIEFEADDGTELVGYYFPAAVNPAPVIVLMHWAGGDQTDWQYTGVVSWLQNRDQPIPAPPQPKFFDTPYTLLTPLPETESYGVFTFDFRGFGESGAGDFASTVADARSAYALVATLPGVDPDRIIGIGASIGAIQVINGCQEDCQGALSIGPQNLLEGFSYATAVTTLDEVDKPAWCIVAADMDVDYEACSEASGRLHQQQIYDEGGHAMMLFRAELDLQPPLDEVILDFIHTVLERP